MKAWSIIGLCLFRHTVVLSLSATASIDCPHVWVPPGKQARSVLGQVTDGGPNFKKKYDNPTDYWDMRYSTGDKKLGHAPDSGTGSRGKNARYKAKVLNAFVSRNDVKRVIDFGCGDGTQLSLSRYPQYTGLDVSKFAVQRLQQRFADDWKKRFILYNGTRAGLTGQTGKLLQADLSFSLEVIFHLTDANIYQSYMELLFDTSKRFVIIMSNDAPEIENCVSGTCYSNRGHLRFWPVRNWVKEHRSEEWRFIGSLQHKYPEKAWSDFFFFARTSECDDW